MKKDWWIRFGCFMTGYNYDIVSRSSEITAKVVKRNTSAMLIVCLLWAFIGYHFSHRYLGVDINGAIIGAGIFTVIIVQIERQIILAVTKTKALMVFRGAMALMMAFLGSLIIDQVIFKNDIEQEKINLLGEKVKKLLPNRSNELTQQYRDVMSAIQQKEAERTVLLADISNNPTITSVERSSDFVPVETTTRDSIKTTTSQRLQKKTATTVRSITNPKVDLLPPINEQIDRLMKKKDDLDNKRLTLRSSLETEIKASVGFLDELNVMLRLLKGSLVAFLVWLLWICFLFGLELFILFSKIGEKENDYDFAIKHQMQLHLKRLELLAKSSESTPVLADN